MSKLVVKILITGGVAATALLGTAATAGAAASWQNFDFNGDGVADSSAYDYNLDGNWDRFFIDQNRDGYSEVIIGNDDYDTLWDWYWIDIDGPGVVEMHDWNNDDRLEHVYIDSDGNGRYETERFDGDGDGLFEWQRLNLYYFDGIADTWSRIGTTTGGQVLNQTNVNHTSVMTIFNMMPRT